jgi:ABC-type dipeptide/oligopeptide/nickel transport system permease component
MGYLICVAVLFSLINLATDLAYAGIDPRVRLG